VAAEFLAVYERASTSNGTSSWRNRPIESHSCCGRLSRGRRIRRRRSS